MTWHLGRWMALGIMIVGLVGCGDGGPPTGDISGKVSYDGKPIEDGAITFLAADGKAPTAGTTIKDGKYTALKVPVGKVKVQITGSKVVGQKKVYNTPNSPVMPITEQYVPAKYNDKTELTYDVTTGSQTKDYELAK